MRFIILVILFIVSGFLTGQVQTFEFKYITPNDDRLWDAFETEDGNIYLTGHIAKPESNKYKGLVLKLSQVGELIDDHLIDIPNRAYDIYGILQDTLGSLILCGKSSDTTPEMYHTNLELKRVNGELTILDSASLLIAENKSIGLLGKAIGINSDFLFTGGLWNDSPPSGHAFAYRLNQSFDSILYYIDNYGSIFHQIKQIDNNSYWHLGRRSGYKFEIRDTLFDYFDSQQVPNRVSQGYGLKWDTDTSFFMVGEWDNNGQDDIGIIRMYHPLDTTGHLFNSWGSEGIYDYPTPNGALDFINKDSIFVGVISPFWPWLNSHSNYVLLQTDSLLNIRWERFYGDGEYYYELMKVLATNDGGCLLAGTRYDYNAGIKERDIYIIKVDNEGLLVSSGEEHNIEMHEALVFPNPGTNYLKIRIATQYPKSIFELFDLNGKLLISEQIDGKWGEINTSFLKPGTYIYKIYNQKGLNESGKWIKN